MRRADPATGGFPILALILASSLTLGPAGCSAPGRYPPASASPPTQTAPPAAPASAAALSPPAPAAPPNEAPPPPPRVDFATQVQPILEAHCVPCHFAGGKMYQALPFDRQETIVKLGEKLFTRLKDPEQQRLIRALLAQSAAASGSSR